MGLLLMLLMMLLLMLLTLLRLIVLLWPGRAAAAAGLAHAACPCRRRVRAGMLGLRLLLTARLLTHSIDRCKHRSVLPTGHVHTYEFHGERCTRAREDFELLGLTPFVTVTQRNTMESGFPEEVRPPRTVRSISSIAG